MIEFTVPGLPIGKGRARISTRGGQVRAFTPAKTVNYEGTLRMYAERAMAALNLTPLQGPLAVRMTAVFPKPQSWSKKRAAATLWHTSRPDADNLMKCLDGLNGIVWRDDAQVCQATISKIYSDDGIACLRVTVEKA